MHVYIYIYIYIRLATRFDRDSTIANTQSQFGYNSCGCWIPPGSRSCSFVQSCSRSLVPWHTSIYASIY